MLMAILVVCVVMSGLDTARIYSFSPSAKLVIKVLEYNDSLTKKEIIRHSQLSRRTVSHALNQLERAEIVEKGICIEDARQNRYQLASNVDHGGTGER